MASQSCLNINIKTTEYKSAIANDYVVLAFFLCFILALVAVIMFTLYVIKMMRIEKEREKQSEKRKTLRQKAAKKLAADVNCDENSSAEYVPLETNYLWSMNEAVDGTKIDDSNQSRNSFLTDGTQASSSISDGCCLEILAALFTSNRNTSPPTNLDCCLWLRTSCFELMKSLHHECFSGLLHLLVHVLFEERKINEIEKLRLITKYEQMLDEEFKVEEISDFTNKLHFVLVSVEKEIQELIQDNAELDGSLFTGERLSKYLNTIQREMLSNQYNEAVKEFIISTENWFTKIIVEKWSNLEVIRYRINVVYESVEELFRKNGEKQENIQDSLNEYLQNIFESLHEFCITYEKGVFDLINQINKDKLNNKKQALMELEAQRFEQQNHALQGLDYTKKKSVSKFVIAQINTILTDFKTITNYQVVINSEGLELFEDFQTITNKKVVKLLKNCEEKLFEKLQKDDILSEDVLVELGKSMSVHLKDFKEAQQKMKFDFMDQNQNGITRIANLLDSLYSTLERKFTKGVDDIKKECLEILHSLSNLQEEQMNSLEHKFETGFSSLVFGLYFVLMGDIICKIHNSLTDIITKNTDTDVSLSLHDMVQILKQDRTVIKRSSLFQMPNKNLYPTVELELAKIEGKLSLAVDDALDVVSRKIDLFFLPKVNEIIQDAIFRQSQQCVSNVYLAKRKLLSSCTNSKGYRWKQASSLAKDCIEQIRGVWESQANFKDHKLKDGKNEIMRDFEPLMESFFTVDNVSTSNEMADECLKLELKFFMSMEESWRGRSVERVLDANLENEIMVLKFYDKMESFEPRSGNDGNDSKKRRSPKSTDSEGGSVRRKESLRHSISRKKKKS